MARLNPVVYRFFVPWNEVQPRADAPPNLALPENGCVRDRGAVRAVRRAARPAARARLRGRLAGDDRAQPGCRTGPSPMSPGARAGPRRSRPCRAGRAARVPHADRRRARARADEGADVRYVSPYNEPNHPYFARAAADGLRPVGAVARRARVRAARRGRARGAGRRARRPGARARRDGRVPRADRARHVVPEMIHELPRSVVCSARGVVAARLHRRDRPGRRREDALDARGCPRRQSIWITETGVGPAPGGLSLARGITSQAQGCRLLHRRLSPGTATRASRSPSSTRSARTTCSRPGSSPPTSPAPARPCGMAGLGRPPETGLTTADQHLHQVRGSVPLTRADA